METKVDTLKHRGEVIDHLLELFVEESGGCAVRRRGARTQCWHGHTEWCRTTSIQCGHPTCPCSSCFFGITGTKNTDWQHICWLILLALRGDYTGEDLHMVIKDIRVALALSKT